MNRLLELESLIRSERRKVMRAIVVPRVGRAVFPRLRTLMREYRALKRKAARELPGEAGLGA